MWLWWTGAGTVATIGYFFLPANSVERAVAYSVFGLTSGVVMLAGARHTDRIRRNTWWLFSAGTLLWATGDVIYSVYQFGLDREPFPSLADVGYIGAYPALIGGFLLLSRARGQARTAAAVIDPVIMATGAGLLLWTLIMQPIARDHTVALDSRVISLIYPAADVILLAMGVRLLVSGAARDASFRLLGAALGLLLAADVGYSVVTAMMGREGGLFDAGWLLSYVLWAAAALHPSARTRGAPHVVDDLRPGKVRLALLAGSSMLAPSVLLVQGAIDPRHVDWLPVGICSIILFALVVLRMGGLVRQVRQLALRDSLTGLANRHVLETSMRELLGTSAQVLLIDLDDFKAINDRLGHGVGDGLLVAVGERLRATARPGDTVARLGGDEFALLLPAADQAGTDHLVGIVVESLAVPFVVDGHDLMVRASIGIACVDALGSSAPLEPLELLRRADVAMYAAKATGGRCMRYEPGLDAIAVERAQLSADLRAALDDRQFFLVFQPIVTLPEGNTVGLETLVRWQHPQRGLVSPTVFIPLAEHNGLIVELGAWILRAACARMASWLTALGPDAPGYISVNVSARQLVEPDLADTVAAALEASGLTPDQLLVEVTETAVFDSDHALTALHAIKALGVRIALDDFGTGHSSLGLLHRAPVDVLKVDKSFVDDITRPGRHAVIAKALIDVTTHMHMVAIAEGVETPDQAAELYRLGYRYAQGYLYGRPTADFRPDPDRSRLTV